MPLVKHTVYFDSYVDSCIREVYAALLKRNVREPSYSLVVNLMLAINILDVANGKGYSREARKHVRRHVEHPVESPLDEEIVKQFSRQMQEILENLKPEVG
jgi:hypothetical protein